MIYKVFIVETRRLKTDRVATEVAKFTDLVDVLMDWSVAVSGASKDFILPLVCM
jgi:hypothetical protein